MCIRTTPMPVALARPLSTHTWSRIMQTHDLCWEKNNTIHPPAYQRYECYQQVTCLRQLLLHQLPLLVVIKWGSFYTKGVLQQSMHKTIPPIFDGWCTWSHDPCQLCQTKSLVRCRTWPTIFDSDIIATVYAQREDFVSASHTWVLRRYFVITT